MAQAFTFNLVGALFCMFLFGQDAGAQPQKRLSWQEFAKDPERVARFREGVRVMKSRDTADPKSAEYRTSWQYWAAIHGYLGAGAKSGTVRQYIDWVKSVGAWRESDQKFFQGIKDMAPPDSASKAVWDQCEHGTPNFFLWHRLYLIHFEKVLRAAAKDDALRLPYWDYTDPAHTDLPAEFRMPTYVNGQGQSVDNPLYQPRRESDWTKSSTRLDPDTTDVDGALNLPRFAEFQTEIEQGLHGTVHCAMNHCPIPAMGAVAYSANDPIFWLHHTNIDRMLSCWSSAAGHKLQGRAKTYSFVNEKGKIVKASTQLLLGGGKLDYSYDKEKDCARGPAPVDVAMTADPTSRTLGGAPASPAKTPSAVVLGSTKNVVVQGDSAKASLALTTTAPTATGAGATTSRVAVPGKRTELFLRGVQLQQHPAVTYKVFISTPGSAKREYAGSLSFFGQMPSAAHHGHAAVNRTLDITDAAKRLGETADLSNLEVSFEASSGRVGDVAKVQANPQATVSIQEIAVRVR